MINVSKIFMALGSNAVTMQLSTKYAVLKQTIYIFNYYPGQQSTCADICRYLQIFVWIIEPPLILLRK